MWNKINYKWELHKLSQLSINSLPTQSSPHYHHHPHIIILYCAQPSCDLRHTTTRKSGKRFIRWGGEPHGKGNCLCALLLTRVGRARYTTQLLSPVVKIFHTIIYSVSDCNSQIGDDRATNLWRFHRPTRGWNVSMLARAFTYTTPHI